MGVTTEFIGFVEIWPPLNAAEQAYLTAFAQSRRYRRPGGPYEIPGNPAAEEHAPPADIEDYNSPGDGQPSLWCQWVPSVDGERLHYDHREKFYGSARWMAYLIDHFLAPDAEARHSTNPHLAGFTFDHVVDGLIAASQPDTGALYTIRVEDNLVITETLWMPREPGFGVPLY